MDGACPRTDVVGSVNTIRLRRYGWNTSMEGSLRRKKGEKNKVEEIQLANLASLGSLASNERILKMSKIVALL